MKDKMVRIEHNLVNALDVRFQSLEGMENNVDKFVNN